MGDNMIKKIFITLILCITLVFLTYYTINAFGNTKINPIVRVEGNEEENYQVEKEVGLINYYAIYGTSFNIKGTISISIDYKDINLVFYEKKGSIISYDLILENNETINFRTSDYINSGINLEKVTLGNYTILLQVIDINDQPLYYNLKNDTTYSKLEYYTITRNNINNKIIIDFHNDEFIIDVTRSVLPEDVYDISIDPGHGGEDWGAYKGKYYEKHIVLDYALSLKSALESLGYKVLITRTNDDTFNTYGDNGRIDTIMNSKAKYNFSIHLNSSGTSYYAGGVEIYAPSASKLEFAEMFAKNIVEIASTKYSTNNSSRISNGVYVRILSKGDINDIVTDAKKKGFIPYEVKDNTTYYFIIRETGGMITNAYTDGRDDNKINPHYLDNIGIESYLLELGYINSSNDLNNILNNKNNYIKALTTTINQYIKDLYE